MHPRWLRCSSLKYSRYSRSSRLAIGAPRTSRCDARLSRRAADVDPFAAQLIAAPRQSGFRDVAGSRISASLPVSRALINHLVAHALAGTTAPVSAVDIRPRDGDRFEAVVTLTWKIAPPLTVLFTIDRQPQWPDSPVL